MPWPLIAAGVGLAGGLLTNRWNAREARRNREFQERMSSTAHQREVEDLRLANINPMFRGMGGASTPAGDRAEMEDVVGKGISGALAAAQLKKMKAETQLLDDQALKTRAEVGRWSDEANAGRFERLVNEVELSRLSVEERRQLVPIARLRAEAEIRSQLSSARAAEAIAELNRLAATGARNVEKFEETIGEMGPTVRFFLNLIRGLR